MLDNVYRVGSVRYRSCYITLTVWDLYGTDLAQHIYRVGSVWYRSCANYLPGRICTVQLLHNVFTGWGLYGAALTQYVYRVESVRHGSCTIEIMFTGQDLYDTALARLRLQGGICMVRLLHNIFIGWDVGVDLVDNVRHGSCTTYIPLPGETHLSWLLHILQRKIPSRLPISRS